MNPRTRHAALYAIGLIAILASANALTHSYAGLYDWAAHHRLSSWQAMSWPAEIDVFLAVGELALYVAYLDGWPARQRIWPWTTALIGLAVSIAGNIGHIQAAPGQPVILADRLTAATSPIAAFAGLAVGLLVLKMTRQRPDSDAHRAGVPATAGGQLTSADHLAEPADTQATAILTRTLDQMTGGRCPRSAPPAHPAARIGNGTADPAPTVAANGDRPQAQDSTSAGHAGAGHGLLQDANLIYQAAAANGERLSQRTLARQLRRHGHRFSNQNLSGIATSIGLTSGKAA